jgi:hypothetical protein
MSENNYIADMVQVDLKSGKKLKIKYCSFGDFLELKKVVLSNLKIKIDSEFLKKEINLSVLEGLVEPIIALMGNRELDEVFFKVSSICTIDGDKITKDFFESPQNRQYYFEVMYHILLENIKVFLPAGVLTE